MSFGRKFLVFIASSVLLTLLLITALTASLRLTFDKPDNLKVWIKHSGIYNNLVDSIVDQSKQPTVDNTTVSLSQPDMKKIINNVFTPQFLESSTNSIIDGYYHWVSGKTSTPDFKIDLSPVKTNLVKAIGDYLNQRMASLPVCTRANMPTTFDPFNATCRPPYGIDINAEIQKVTGQLASSPDFLPNTQLTAANFNTQENGQPFTQQNSPAPKIYKWIMLMPFIAGALSLLAIAGVIFGTIPRRKGFHHVATSMLIAGLLLAGGNWIGGFLYNKLSDKILHLNTDAAPQLQNAVVFIAKQIEHSLERYTYIFAAIYGAVAIVTFIVLIITKGKTAKPSPVETPKTEAPAPQPAKPIQPKPESTTK